MEETLTNTKPGAQRASGKQQKQFDLLLGRARQMMGKSGEEWISALKADPVQAAVTMGVETIRELTMMSEKAGSKVDPAVLVNVGVQFVKDIAAVANAAGAVPDEELEGYLKDVMSQSIAQYLKLDAEDGLLSPEDKKQAQALVAQNGGGMAEPAPPAAPAQPAPEAPMPEEDPAAGQDDPEMAAELEAIRKAKGGMQ